MTKALRIQDLTCLRPSLSNPEKSSILLDSEVLLGLEVETENLPLRKWYHWSEGDGFTDLPFRYWRVRRDPSLKGTDPWEFVFIEPLGGKNVVRAVRELAAYLAKNKDRLVLSERASLQVHLDFRPCALHELTNFVVLYAVFEKALYRYCGSEREHSIFCTPLWKMNDDIPTIAQVLNSSSMQEFTTSLQYVQKYSGLNLAPLARYGSVEVRMHPAERRSKPILQWVNLLLCLHKAARKGMTWHLPDAPVHMSQVGFEQFAKRIFGTKYELIWYPGIDQHILDGIRVAQDILYSPAWNAETRSYAKKTSYSKSSLKAFRPDDIPEEALRSRPRRKSKWEVPQPAAMNEIGISLDEMDAPELPPTGDQNP